MTHYLDFEKPLAEIEGKAEELRAMARGERGDGCRATRPPRSTARPRPCCATSTRKLTPWRKCQVARHPERPHCTDYIAALFTEYTPLAGDRNFADDHAVMGGLARFDDRPVMVIGHEKGNDTKSRIERNFGMARPEGYRKAIRLMEMADRFGLPVVTLVDTPGAYPGKGAEERGQSEAIARATETCLQIGVPLVSRRHRRGRIGRGRRLRHRQPRRDAGAFGLFGDLARGLRIDPLEGRREDARGRRGAAPDRAGPASSSASLDRIVAEPMGGAHRDPEGTPWRACARDAARDARASSDGKGAKALIADRREKFLEMGSKGTGGVGALARQHPASPCVTSERTASRSAGSSPAFSAAMIRR